MARRTKQEPLPEDFEEHILDTDIRDEMQSSFLEYAYSVIYSRALPDARDGLKPVQRRILYTMNDMRLMPDRGHTKCARIVGEVMGRLHPHGDGAIYDALVRIAQYVVAAAAAGRRPRQLRLPRRRGPAGGHALHRGPDGAGRGGHDGVHRTRTPSTSSPQLRQPAEYEPTVLPSAIPQPASSTAPPASRSAWRPTWPRTTSSRSSQALRHLHRSTRMTDARRPDALHPRPRPPHGRQDRRPRRHPRRLRDGPRHLQDARDGPGSRPSAAATGIVVTELPYVRGPGEGDGADQGRLVQTKKLPGHQRTSKDLTDREHGLRLVIEHQERLRSRAPSSSSCTS